MQERVGLNRSNLPELRRALPFLMLRKQLQASGLFGLILGLAAILLGMVILGAGQQRLSCCLFGAVLLVGGLHSILAPSWIALWGYGALLVLGGSWQVATMARNFHRLTLLRFDGALAVWAVLIGLQLLWGTCNILLALRLRGVPHDVPSASTEEAIRAAVQSLLAANPEETPDVLAFTIVSKRRQHWRVRLLAEIAVFVVNNMEALFFLDKEEVEIELREEKPPDTALVVVRFWKTAAFAAVMPRRHWERYKSWKESRATA